MNFNQTELMGFVPEDEIWRDKKFVGCDDAIWNSGVFSIQANLNIDYRKIIFAQRQIRFAALCPLTVSRVPAVFTARLMFIYRYRKAVRCFHQVLLRFRLTEPDTRILPQKRC
jgi:hypothetical protein